MTNWHTNHTSYSGYILSNFIAFPIISWVILFLVILYFNSFAPEPRMKKVKSVLESSNKVKIWACKLSLQNEFTLSLIFVLFSTSLASSAVAFACNTENRVNPEVRKYFADNSNVPIQFRHIFSLGYVVLGLDVVVLAIMLACGIFCKYISKWLFNFMSTASSKDQTQSAKNLTSAIKSLAAAAKYLPESTLATEASSLAAAMDQLQKHVIFMTIEESKRTSVQEITKAWDQLDKVKKKKEFKMLSEVGAALTSLITACKEKGNAAESCQTTVRLGKKLKNLGEKLSFLKGSIDKKIIEKFNNTLTHLREAAAKHEIKPAIPVGTSNPMGADMQLETFAETRPTISVYTYTQMGADMDLEAVTYRGKFERVIRSLESFTTTLNGKLEKIMISIEEKLSEPLQEEEIETSQKDVKLLCLTVAHLQAQANALALAISSIAGASAILIKNTKEISERVTEEMAKKSLVTAEMNFNAAELTIATSLLTREEIDLASLRASLIDVGGSLTAASKSTESKAKKMECGWHMITINCNKAHQSGNTPGNINR